MAYYNVKLGHYFIHIAKTGGTSAGIFLQNLPGDYAFTPLGIGHASAITIEKHLKVAFPNINWQGVTLLRHPLKRYISGYDYSFYVSKALMEKQQIKGFDKIRDPKKTWLLFGQLTPDNFLHEYIKFKHNLSSINFAVDLPFVVPVLRRQKEFVLDSTIKFNLESIENFHNYYQNIIGESLPNIPIEKSSKLYYANLTELKQKSLEFIETHYSDDYSLGGYTKKIIKN